MLNDIKIEHSKYVQLIVVDYTSSNTVKNKSIPRYVIVKRRNTKFKKVIKAPAKTDVILTEWQLQ